MALKGLSSILSRNVLRLPVLQSGRTLANTLSWRSLVTGAQSSNKANTENIKTDGTSNPTSSSETTDSENPHNEEYKKLSLQLEEVQDKYRRSLAETENVRQRLKKQIDDARLFGVQGFCKDLLEVADILSRATESIPKENLKQMSPENAVQSLTLMHEGLRLTESQLLKVFERHGLTKICPTEGEKFDPNVHEALFQQPISEGKQKGTVAVLSKVGYKLHSRTLRPALVGVFG